MKTVEIVDWTFCVVSFTFLGCDETLYCVRSVFGPEAPECLSAILSWNNK